MSVPKITPALAQPALLSGPEWAALRAGLLLLALAVSGVAGQSCPSNAGDCTYLGDLYLAAGGASWTRRDGWCDGGDCCGWTGITCSGALIERIDLSSNSLVGSLPDSLGSLGEVHQLNVARNSLSGAIPDGYGAMTSLQWLDIHQNRFSGTIGSLADSTVMRVIFADSNMLSGTIPDAQLSAPTSLQVFDVDQNRFSGTIPRSVESMTSLMFIRLNGNSISGTIPSQLATLTAVENIDLGANSLSGVLPASVSSLTRLAQLAVPENRISGSLPDLSTLTSLEYIQTEVNEISGTLPETPALTAMLGIFIALNRFSGSLPSSISSMTRLQHLIASDNSISGSIPTVYQHLTSMAVLTLDQNNLSGSSDESFSQWQSLQLLSLFHNSDLNWDLNLLTHFGVLHTALLHSCAIDGTIPQELQSATSLAALLLSKNRLRGTIPDLSVLSSLKTLTLSSNQISGTLPNTALPNLDKLLANELRLSGSLPQAWGSERRSGILSVTDIGLARNYLRGTTNVFDLATSLETLLLSGALPRV